MLSSRSLRAVAGSTVVACAALGLVADAQAFTLIEPPHSVVIGSTGPGGPADAPSETANRPRYSVTDNGFLVVFTSRATKLATGQDDTNDVTDVFLYNVVAQTVVLVSHSGLDANKAARGRSDQPVISPDGRFVVFRSTADDIVPGAGYLGQSNIFLWDVDGDTFTLVSHAFTGPLQAGNDNSLNAVINRTPAGRPVVAFESIASNLVSEDSNDASDIFRFDSGTPDLDLVSVPNFDVGDRFANGGSFHPDIDATGTCIVYESLADNLVSSKPSDDANIALDVFRWKFAAEPAVTLLISHLAGAPSFGAGAVTGGGESTEPSIDDACKRFAFKSTVKDLAPGQGENNGGNDVFHEESLGDAVLVSHADGSPDKTGNGESLNPILSRDGEWVAYDSVATDLASGQTDTPGTSDVFLFDVAGGKTLLVSHLAKDDKVATGGSSLPEISLDGHYVAYESSAKDLDPNQNDGNGGIDVFLYNRQWNNSVLGSRRYASIAISGNRKSYRPALSGNGLFMAFTSEANDLIADDPDTSGQTDVFVFWSIVPFKPLITTRSTSNTNVIEWVTPPTNYLSLKMFFSVGACPATFAAATNDLLIGSPQGNSRGQLTHPGLTPNTTYCYAIFLQQDDGTGFLPGDAPWATRTARTFSNPSGRIQWTLNLADISLLTQVGIGTQNHVAVAQDGGVYGFTRGPGGGFWSGSSWPFRVSKPIQGRPPIVGFSTLGASRTTFVGSQDGRAYAFDADRVSLTGGALWYTTPKLGDLIQPGAAGMFSVFGGIGDYILLGARTGASATFYALDAATGAQRGLLTGSVGAISTSASVDYTLKQVYFTGQINAGGPTLGCLTLTATGFGPPCWTAIHTANGISGGPVQRSGKVYVGDDGGNVYAVDTVGGSILWGPYAACGGGNPIRSYVLADRLGTGQDLYYTAGTSVCAVTDNGAPSLKWGGAITLPLGATPSTPILVRIGAAAYLYVGGSDGRLYQIDANNPSGLGGIKKIDLRLGSVVGGPAFDVFDNMLYVGSDEGIVYAVQAPLP